MSHVINSRALTGEKPCINKAIHALLMHGYATFNMLVPGPQNCCPVLPCWCWCVLPCPRTSGLGFQHLPWNLANVNAWKTMFDPYIPRHCFCCSFTEETRVFLSTFYHFTLWLLNLRLTDFALICWPRLFLSTISRTIAKSKHWQHWWVDCLWVQARKMVQSWNLKQFRLTLNFLLSKQTEQTLFRPRKTRRLTRVCAVCQCPSPGFTDSPLYMPLNVTVAQL